MLKAVERQPFLFNAIANILIATFASPYAIRICKHIWQTQCG
jgi:hypothetical protein